MWLEMRSAAVECEQVRELLTVVLVADLQMKVGSTTMATVMDGCCNC